MLKKSAFVGPNWQRGGIVAVTALSLLSILAGWNPAFAEEFDILNQTKTTIYHLYVAPEGASHWSDDALGEDEEDALEPGDSITLRDLDPGRYKFKMVVENDRDCIVPNVQLQAGRTLELDGEFLERCR